MAILTHEDIKYQSEGKLLSLVTTVSEASSLKKVGEELDQAIRIWYLLKAINTNSSSTVPGVPFPDLPWILATGVWNDGGIWIDSETWNDN